MKEIDSGPPSRIWLPIYCLDKLKEIITATKFQKLIFLIQTEGKTKSWFDYHWHHFGPYSQDLRNDLSALCSQDLINIEPMTTTKGFETNRYSILAQGQSLLETMVLEPEIRDDLRRVDKIIDKYGRLNYQEILEIVYARYDLDLNELTKKLEANLWSLNKNWLQLYKMKSDCIYCTYALAMIEYSETILDKILNKSIDKLTRQICLRTINDMINHLGEVTSVCSNFKTCPFDCKPQAKECIEYFEFLQKYCQDKQIYPAVEDLKLSDIMAPEQIDKMLEDFQQQVTSIVN